MFAWSDPRVRPSTFAFWLEFCILSVVSEQLHSPRGHGIHNWISILMLLISSAVFGLMYAYLLPSFTKHDVIDDVVEVYEDLVELY